MSAVTCRPAIFRGEIAVPTSKSLAHRAILAAALAPGTSVIRDVSMSEDIAATLDAAVALGASYTIDGNDITLTGRRDVPAEALINARESGSTLRFLMPVAMVQPMRARFTGQGKLASRPLDVYEDIFKAQGLVWDNQSQETLDLTLSGSLHAGTYDVRGDVSSQFITGLLYALPLLDRDSVINLTTPLASRGYVDLTLDVLKDFGIRIDADFDAGTFAVPGFQTYQAHDYKVEGDFSQAAYPLVLGAMGMDVTVTNLNLNSRQGDRVILDILRDMGAFVEVTDTGLKVAAGNLHGAVIDAGQCPDLMPPVAALAGVAQGTTVIKNAGRLRLKECDRLHAICDTINRAHGLAVEGEDQIVITGVAVYEGCDVLSYNDHRMAMMAAVMAARSAGPIHIDNQECVRKSWPHFFDDYEKLGGECA